MNHVISNTAGEIIATRLELTDCEDQVIVTEPHDSYHGGYRVRLVLGEHSHPHKSTDLTPDEAEQLAAYLVQQATVARKLEEWATGDTTGARYRK